MSTANPGSTRGVFILGIVIWGLIFLWSGPWALPPLPSIVVAAEKVPVCLVAIAVFAIQVIGLRKFGRQANRSMLTYLRAFCLGGIVDLCLVAFAWHVLNGFWNAHPIDRPDYWAPYVAGAAVIGAFVGVLPALIFQRRHAYNSILWVLFSAVNLAAVGISLADPTPLRLLDHIFTQQMDHPEAISAVIALMEVFMIAEVITSSSIVLRSRKAVPADTVS